VKFLLLLAIILPMASFAQDEVEDEVIETSASDAALTPTGAVDPAQAKAMMEKLQKGQKAREEQNKFLEEMDSEE